MMRNRIVTVGALVAGLALAGCSDFDPIDKFQDLDIMSTSKTPLKGTPPAMRAGSNLSRLHDVAKSAAVRCPPAE